MFNWRDDVVDMMMGGPAEAPKGDLPSVEEVFRAIGDGADLHDPVGWLKDLSKKEECCVDIGNHIADMLKIIKHRSDDTFVVSTLLEVLTNVMSTESDSKLSFNNSPAEMNTETFLEENDNVLLVLEQLRSLDFYVRFNAITLLNTCVSRQRSHMQACIMTSPQGVPLLMDLLDDKREIVRNEGILLLCHLTKGSQEIQKIVAFENAFERILSIIEEEGNSEGGVVVYDCVDLIVCLLRGNVSNQNYFRETRCIHRLPPILDVKVEEISKISEQKMHNLVAVLGLVSLLTTGNDANATNNQTAVVQEGLLQLAITLCMGPTPAGQDLLRTCALRMIGDSIRGHAENQVVLQNAARPTYFETYQAYLASLEKDPAQPSGDDSSPCLHYLLQIAFKGDRGLPERSAALYVFSCYLLNNPSAQMSIAASLAPAPTDAVSMGHYMASTLGAWQSAGGEVPAWGAALLLGRVVDDNPDAKDLLLRVPIAFGGAEGTPLVSTCINMLSSIRNAGFLRVQVSVFSLLCMLASDSAEASSALLAGKHMPFLVETIINSSTAEVVQGLAALLFGLCIEFSDDSLTPPDCDKQSLMHVIIHRIGVDQYTEKLDGLRKSVPFSRAEREPASVVLSGDDMAVTEEELGNRTDLLMFDYGFTVMYKNVYDRINRSVVSGQAGGGRHSSPSLGAVSAANKAAQQELTMLKKSYENCQERLAEAQRTVENKLRTIEEQDVALEECNRSVVRLQGDLDVANQKAQDLEEALVRGSTTGSNSSLVEAELRALRSAYSDLETELLNKDETINNLRSQVASSVTGISRVDPVEFDQLKQLVVSLQREKAELVSRVATPTKSKLFSSGQAPNGGGGFSSRNFGGHNGDEQAVDGRLLGQLRARVEELEELHRAEQAKCLLLEEEQEDLFVCLAEEEIKNLNMRSRLAEVGILVTDEDLLDDEDGNV